MYIILLTLFKGNLYQIDAVVMINLLKVLDFTQGSDWDPIVFYNRRSGRVLGLIASVWSCQDLL